MQLGEATVTRVVETVIEMSTDLFPSLPDEVWRDDAGAFQPFFVNSASGRWRAALQSWIIEVDGLTVVVDTGVGNGRERPNFESMNHLSTDYAGALQRAGVRRESVDVVVNTHLHTDHVGWNTHFADGRWQPMFPNARYLMPEPDYRYFSPDSPTTNDGMRIVFSDSVLPVADQTQLYAGDYQLSESLWLRPAPGHTPGSSAVWLDAGTGAVFVGDVTHSPVQIARPDASCTLDVDAGQAAATRKQVLAEACKQRAIVLPAHYPGHGGATLHAHGERFEIDEWIDLPPI